MTFVIREGWYWPEEKCSKGHESPRDKFKHCVLCVREYRKSKGHFYNDNAKKWRGENRSHLNEHRRNWNRSNPEKRILMVCRKVAKERGLPFNLEESDIIIPEFCPVLGIRLELPSKARTDASVSIDRITPSLGYVKGNIVIVSWRANFIKSDATLEELKRLVEYYGNIASKN
tara:strand:+ start:221 stop:739 length:519 start_codon:yes stop_codon:yes gene_type:complete